MSRSAAVAGGYCYCVVRQRPVCMLNNIAINQSINQSFHCNDRTHI